MDYVTYSVHGSLMQKETFGSWDNVLHRRGFEGAVNDFLLCLKRPNDCQISARQVMESHKLAERLIRS